MRDHRWWRRTGALLALSCLAGLAGMTGPAGLGGSTAGASRAPDTEAFELKLLEAPVERRDDPRARRYVVDHLSPGSVITRKLLVRSHSSESQRIAVYPAAATIDDGEFQFGEDRSANELTSWITLNRSGLELEPGDEATVTMTLRVPPSASKGERYGVIWAEVASRPDPSANVNQVNRVGVRVYLDIGPGGEPPSDFEIGEVTPARDKTGEPSLAIEVTNTGQRAIDLSGSASLSEGPAGLAAGPFPIDTGSTLGPGQEGTVLIRFPRELPNGPWTVDVDLQSGLVHRTATGTVTFPDPGQVGRSSFLSSAVGTPWGTAAASLAVGLVILSGLAMIVRRSRRRAQLAR